MSERQFTASGTAAGRNPDYDPICREVPTDSVEVRPGGFTVSRRYPPTQGAGQPSGLRMTSRWWRNYWRLVRWGLRP